MAKPRGAVGPGYFCLKLIDRAFQVVKFILLGKELRTVFSHKQARKDRISKGYAKAMVRLCGASARNAVGLVSAAFFIYPQISTKPISLNRIPT
jgi:hypothetical protein